MPGGGGPEAEVFGHGLHDLQATPPHRRQRADRGAELHDQQARPDLVEALAVAGQRRQPVGGLQPEGRGQGLLRTGSRRHHRIRVAAGGVGEFSDNFAKTAGHMVAQPGEPQHQAGINDVLAGRAPMDVGRRLAADMGAKLVDEGDGGNAGYLGSRPQVLEVGLERGRGRGDPLRRVRRDQPDPRLSPRQRGLDRDHGADRFLVGEQRRRLRVREQPVENPAGAAAHALALPVSGTACAAAVINSVGAKPLTWVRPL